MICILMGVSGSGKSTIGTLLGQRLGWPFYDGDFFHPPENIDKMSRGISLMDSDRYPWLDNLRSLMHTQRQQQQDTIIACSALKNTYRDYLQGDSLDIIWIYLKGTYGVIWQRMQQRDHFMKPEMLVSQFDSLEEPDNATVIDISLSTEEIIEKIIEVLNIKNVSKG